MERALLHTHAIRVLQVVPAVVCVCVPAQGDYVEILIMTKDGVRREELTLKLD